MTRVRRLRDWWVPTVAGSVSGFWLTVTVHCLSWRDCVCERSCAGAGGDWACVLTRATGLGVALAAIFVGMDVVLARRGLREIPQSRRALWVSFAGPLLAELFWIRPGWDIELLPRSLVVFGKLVVTALMARMIFGRLPRGAGRPTL